MALVEYEYSLLEPISIIGDFTTGETVNIELWQDGILQTITSSGCTEIDETGKFGWSTGNIAVLTASKVQYHWKMQDGSSNSVEGDFVLQSVEGEDGGFPRDKDSYILRI